MLPDIATIGVGTELERFFAASRLRASDYGEHYVALWDCLEQASTGGKRVRPALVLAAFTGLGGTDLSLATPVAVSFELLHTAFVIHDDVIDRDLARRGVANIAGRFTERAPEKPCKPHALENWKSFPNFIATIRRKLFTAK